MTRQDGSTLRGWVPNLLGLLALAVLAAFAWHHAVDHAEKSAEELKTVSEGLARSLGQDIKGDLDYFTMLSTEMAEHGSVQESFEQFTDAFLYGHPGLIDVAWIDSDFVIRQSASTSPDRGVVGLRVAVPEPLEALVRARDTGTYCFSHPFELKDGVPGLLVYIPSSDSEGRFIGAVGGVYSLQDMVSDGVPDSVLERYRVELLDPEGLPLASGGVMGDIDTDLVIAMPIEPTGGMLTLRLYPYLSNPLGGWYPVMLGVIAVLVVGLVWGWASRNSLYVRLEAASADMEQAERAVKDSEQRLKAIMDNIPYRAWLKTEDGRVVEANEPYMDACGLTRDELVGRDDFEIWPRETAEYFVESDRKVEESGERVMVEEHIVEEDGTDRWFETIKTPIFDSEGKFAGTAGIAHEITERILLEKQRNDLHAMISHDIRTPLTLITGNLDMLESRYAEDEAVMSLAGVIRRSAAKISGMFEDYVALSRLEAAHLALKPMPTDVREAVKEAFSEFEEAARRKKLEFGLDVGDGPLKAELDRSYFHRALSNLIQNAINYTPGGGEVRVAVRPDPDGGAGWLSVEVSDSGPGIAASERLKVFQKYYRSPHVASKVKGSGLGLAIVKAVAEAHGGRVTLEENPGGGCVFGLMLPVMQPDVPDRNAHA